MGVKSLVQGLNAAAVLDQVDNYSLRLKKTLQGMILGFSGLKVSSGLKILSLQILHGGLSIIQTVPVSVIRTWAN